MPEHRIDVPGETYNTPAWFGSYDTEIRKKSIRLPKAWRPEKPLPVVRLVCESADDLRMVWLISREQFDQQMNTDTERVRILAQDETTLKPDGMIRLPDIFLECFSDLSDAQITLVGMHKHIEISRREDLEQLENATMMSFDELCRQLENGGCPEDT